MRLVLVVAFLLPVLALAQPQPLGRDDYAVYAAVLQGHYVARGSTQLVLYNWTGSGERDSVRELGEDVSAEALSDFAERNVAAAPLENRFGLKVPVTILKPQEISPHIGDDPDRFVRAFPGAIAGAIAFSRIGFDRARTKAVLTVSDIRARLWAHGWACLVERDARAWHLVRCDMLWIS